jgi:hypothetical protein
MFTKNKFLLSLFLVGAIALSLALGGIATDQATAAPDPHFILAQVQSAQSSQPRSYNCSAKDLGFTRDKIDIEFSYPDLREPLRNLYVTTTQTLSGKQGTWDALFSTDGESSFWTTPVLREIAIGTAPLTIILNAGRGPVADRFEARFYDHYPVKCR